jgi:uncharacterized alkaline shock family protein YloU
MRILDGMADENRDAPVESVLSTTASAHISHAVIASYAAAAVLEVPGVSGISGSGGPEREIEPERAPKGVRVSGDGRRVDLELHLVTEWGAPIPAVAREVERRVRLYLASMIELEPTEVAVVVDDVAAPIT